MMKNRSPDFIGIGAARSGSTWLYKQLQSHSQVWMPPVKELHYFDRDEWYPSPNSLSIDKPVERLLRQGNDGRRLRRQCAGVAYRDVRRGCLDNMPWLRRYMFGEISDEWYKSLFRSSMEDRVGEITPAYAMLNDEDVQKVNECAPNAIMFYLIRNPVERVWSQAFHSGWANQLDFSSLDKNQLDDWLDLPGVKWRSDYSGTIERYRRCCGADRVKVLFYDDVVEKPGRVMSEVANALAVHDAFNCEDILGKQVNQVEKTVMPNWIRDHLSRTFMTEMRKVADLCGGRANGWVSEAEAVLS